MTSYLNTINSEGVVLNLNNTAGYGVVIGNSLTSILGSRTFGDSTIGVISGTSATFSSTLDVTGLATFGLGGLTSTAGTTTLGATTLGAITGTSATFSSTLGVTGITTLSQTTIGAITGTSASFSSNTSSSSITTGALTVVGGISSQENINIGGYLGLYGSTSGNVNIRTQATTGTYNFNLPTSSGSAGQFLTSQGGLSSPMTWTTPLTGTVTSVAISVPQFLNVTGSPVTSSGTISIGFSGTALDVVNGGTGSTSFTSGGLLVGNGTGNLGVSIGASYSNNTLTLPKLISNDSTSTTSSTTGSVLLSGGLGISNSTDATSSSSGGSITTAGGLAVAKKLFVGGSSSFNGLDLNNTKITNLQTPTISTDAATKGYVDNVVQGLDAKQSVLVATTISGTFSSSFQNGETIDGITLTTGDRILIKNQGDVNNGVFIVNSTGSPTRAFDFDTGSSAAGSFLFIERGTVNSETGWVCSSDSGSDTIGTNTLTFVQFSGAGSIVAGTGLSKNGNELSVNVSQTQITELGTITTGVWNSSVIGVLYGGTGSSSFTSNGLLVGNGTGNLGVSIGASYSSNTLTLPKLISNDSTSTTSSTTGSVLLSGGLGISNSTDATSITNGGSITTAGGVAISKTLLVGGNVGIGIDNPVCRLHVVSNIQTSETLRLENTFNGDNDVLNMLSSNLGDGNNNVIVFGKSETVNNTFLLRYNHVSQGSNLNNMSFEIQGSSKIITFVGNGNVGIGTINPGYKLDISGNLRATDSIFTNATPSTSSTTGIVLLSGGLGISNTTDSVSYTNGGSLTSAGGLAIAKKAFIGDSLNVFNSTSSSGFLAKGSTSGVVSILPQSNSGTFNFNLPITAGSAGQVLASSGGGSSAMSWVTPAVSAAPQTYNATGSQSQVTPQNVTGLVYATGSFDISMTVDIIATTSLKQIYKLTGILSPSSGWSITVISVSGDETNVDFSISAGGQIQYTSGTYSGFISLTFYWSEFSTTQGLSYLALSGAQSGIVSVVPQPDSGTFNFNLPITSGTSGEALLSSGGGSNAMVWGKPWSTTTTFTGLNNQVSPVDLNSLVWVNGCFEINILVTIVATTNLQELQKLMGVKKGDNTWVITTVNQLGDNSGVIFSISSSGQLRYTSSNYPGFVSLTLKSIYISDNFS